jgi:sulfur-carrier protein adenylyltransferase/sulfurtransferase
MFLLKGDEGPLEVVPLAYGLEEGLRSFYETMAGKSGEPDVRDSLLKLAGTEVNHKERLFRLYATLDGSIRDQGVFEGGIVSRAMEGGFTTEEFLERNKPSLESAADVIGMAMMLETQALDLYMRFSRKSSDPRSREVFHDLAEEEKTHLSALSRIIGATV